MAFAMKTACCGNPLRTVCLFLLYFNLIVHTWALWSSFRKLAILEIVEFTTFLDLFFKVLGCLIFLSTIITIYNEKPSLNLLTAAVWFLIVYVVYSIYFVIIPIVNGSAKKMCDNIIEEKATRFHDEKQKDEFKRWMKSNYSLFMFLTHLFVLLFVCVVFELYSAWVCYSYIEDLKGRPAYGRPPRNINTDDKEANIPATYTPKAQIITPQYPIPPPQCHDQPPPYFYPPTQNYPQAPPPYQVVCE